MNWETYDARQSIRGATRREATFKREARYLTNKLQDNLSFQEVLVDGEPRNLAILNSDALNIKTICTIPGEDIPHGGLVQWMGNHWLITEKDAGTELYAKATMKQCNYLLRWVADDMSIIERWCIIEDGTKYLIGEYADRDLIVTRGDSRVSMTLARDEYTVRLGRDHRFIIDDYGAPNPLAYRLTKPFKLGGSYNGSGVLNFVLLECNVEDSDNLELHIANYYDFFPREGKGGEPTGSEDPSVGGSAVSGKKVWI